MSNVMDEYQPYDSSASGGARQERKPPAAQDSTHLPDIMDEIMTGPVHRDVPAAPPAGPPEDRGNEAKKAMDEAAMRKLSEFKARQQVSEAQKARERAEAANGERMYTTREMNDIVLASRQAQAQRIGEKLIPVLLIGGAVAFVGGYLYCWWTTPAAAAAVSSAAVETLGAGARRVAKGAAKAAKVAATAQ